MSEKLYNFLLVDEKKIRESEYFDEYTSKGMYLKLRDKYIVMLSTLEYLQKIAEMKVEELSLIKKGFDKDEQDKKCEIERLKEEYEFEDSDIDLYIRKINGEAKKRDEAKLMAFEEEELAALAEICALQIINQWDVAVYQTYKEAIKNIKTLKHIFYKSYGFNEKYENRAWTNSCEEHTQLVIEFFERVFVFEDNLINEHNEDNFHMAIYNIVSEITKFYNMYLEIEDRIKEDRIRKNTERSSGIICGIDDMDEFEEYVRSLNGEKNLRSSFIPLFIRIVEITKSEAELYSRIFPAEKIMVKYVEETKRLEGLINEYEQCFSTINAKFANKEQSLKEKINREKAKEKQDKIYNEMIDVLRSVIDTKKSIFIQVRKFFERKTKYVKQTYFEEIDGILYNELFNALREEIRKRFNSNENSENGSENNTYYIRTNRNSIFEYGDKLIVTLSFPNTDLQEYKTAAIIVDADKINHMYADSSNAAWTYKHSRKASAKEYEIKTMKPDKVTINSGKTDLAQMLFGDVDKCEKTYYVTDSHKFDFRCKHIKKVDMLQRKTDERYHQGKIRFDERTVDMCICKNMEENVHDASILYFDDMDRFKEFLDNM